MFPGAIEESRDGLRSRNRESLKGPAPSAWNNRVETMQFALLEDRARL
jgi:hypothetical protein